MDKTEEKANRKTSQKTQHRKTMDAAPYQKPGIKGAIKVHFYQISVE